MTRYALLMLIFVSAAPCWAGFILDPNTGSYSSSDTTPRPRPESLSEKQSAAKSLATLNSSLADYNKYYRYYRYAYVGVGAKQGSVDRGGVSGSGGTGVTGTIGFDFDGLQWLTPFILEARGNFGFSPPTGETAIFWYLGGPVSRALWNKDYDIPNPINDDLRAGVPFGTAVQRNGGAIEDWATQYLPVKLELGIGYQGISFEQAGGTVVDNGAKTKSTTTGMLAGLAYAARLGYFGKNDMVRLTAYYLVSNQAKTGGKFPSWFLGGDMEMDATVRGKMLEGKLDWYHRLDERVRSGNWITGFGLSLIGRRIHLDEGKTDQWRGAGVVTTVFPAQDVTQAELLVTVGYMR
ncbi:MAG: hypothetical protein M1377_03905 [Deltaproteobacteria bacterium]|nr:hypothetical protein [Deltaproteobacteria bacterium]